MSGGISATKLRLLLSISIALLIAAMIGSFLFIHSKLNTYASEISALNADAQSGDANIQTLKTVQERLDAEKRTIVDARSIVAESANFSDVAISNISRIAKDTGVNITSFEFADSSSNASTTPTSATTPAAATPGTADAGAPATAASGITKRVVTVTIESPLPYNKLMDFIRRIETNDLKMQLSSVSMAKGEGNNVSTQTFSIEVYVRS
jgi:uncharacterized protein (UPF0333 family)